MNYLFFQARKGEEGEISELNARLAAILPLLLVASVFFTFALELANLFHPVSNGLAGSLQTSNIDQIDRAKTTHHLVQMLFGVGFLAGVMFVTDRFKPIQVWAKPIVAVATIALAVWVIVPGYEAFDRILAWFLANSPLAATGDFLLKYLIMVPLGVLVWRQVSFLRTRFSRSTDWQSILMVCHAAMLFVLARELSTWLLVTGIETDVDVTYRAWLSGLAGLYGFFMIVVGMKFNQAIVRYWAFGLIGLTLTKVFVLDLVYIGTGAKIGVFLALGVVLLIISFLYQRFKEKLTDDEPVAEDESGLV